VASLQCAGDTAGVRNVLPGDAPDETESVGGKFGDDEVARRLAAVMDAAGAAAGLDRARLIIVRNGRLAAIERFRQRRHYWLLPGGGVEEGETIGQAALREGAEELGLAVSLGPLRVLVHHRLEDGSAQRHWCFEASVDSDDIRIAGGPELDDRPEDGTYEAVWLGLDDLAGRDVYPAAAVQLVARDRGEWPAALVQVTE
jgi:8-oxo-dGTP diphosphatase